MKARPRKFIAYTAAGRAFAVWTGSLMRAVREAESTKEARDEILAVVDASCVPATAADDGAANDRPFLAILLWNQRYTAQEEPLT